jgi:hypothetical protein
MKKFPKREPMTRVSDLPKEEVEVITEDTIHEFIPLKIAEEREVAVYTYPERDLEEIGKLKVLGKILVDGKECIEVDSSDGDCNVRIFIEVTDEHIHYLKKIVRIKDKRPMLVDIDVAPIPRRLFVGLEWKSQEVYRCGDQLVDGSSEDTRIYCKVVGISEVIIEKRSWKCLRLVMSAHVGMEKPVALIEAFVSIDSGRAVLSRRYLGPGMAHLSERCKEEYEKLKDSPELEYESVAYRLFSTSIPDHSLDLAE